MDPTEVIIDENELKDERINLENLTYYYSKFDIFGDSFNFYFTKYEIFKKLKDSWNREEVVKLIYKNCKEMTQCISEEDEKWIEENL